MERLTSKLFKDNRSCWPLEFCSYHFRSSWPTLKRFKPRCWLFSRHRPFGSWKAKFELGIRPTTASAVLRYKTERQIVNRAYQTQPDNIVGKMTMKSLDQEIAALADSQRDSQIAAGILRILERLDRTLLSYPTALTPRLRFNVERIRLQAIVVAHFDPLTDADVLATTFRGERDMDANAPKRRPQVIVFAAAPVIAAGAALTAAEAALILAVLALAAILLLCAISPEFRQRGNSEGGDYRRWRADHHREHRLSGFDGAARRPM